MGGQLSANYTDIKQIKTVDCWKIHSAVHKTTNERVSLWIIDQDLLKQKFPDKTLRNLYLDNEIASIQQLRKLRHPHVIKVMEYLEKKPDVGFASEPIDDMEYLDTKEMHPLDATYISYQIAEVLSFINSEAHILHLGLCPQAVLIDKELNVHLTKFDFATQIVNPDNIQPSTQLLADSRSSNSNNSIRPPEFLKNNELSQTSDVFVFGLFLYKCFTGRDLYSSGDSQQILNNLNSYTNSLDGVPDEFKYILQQCLSTEPVRRPIFQRILEDPAFNSVQMKSLRYIDMILTKQAPDKFKFYKGLGTKIEYFSPKLQRVKLLPKLLEECKNDVRFAPILLASIFQISQNYDSRDFHENVWSKIAFLSGVTDPPEVAIALLRNMWLLLKKLDIRLHKDYVYPIFFTALQNKNPKVQSECLEKVNLIIEEMNDQRIHSTIIPRLMDLYTGSEHFPVAVSALKCIAKCLEKSDSETFVNDFFPKISENYSKRANENSAQAILEIIKKLKGSPDVMLSKVVPLMCQIAGGHQVRDDLKYEFCTVIINIATQMRDYKENVASMKSGDTDNPFTAKPIHAANTAADVFGSPAPAPQAPVNKVTAANTADDIFGDMSPKPSNPPPIASTLTSLSTSSPNLAAPPNNTPAKPKSDGFDPFSSDFIGNKPSAPSSAKPATLDFTAPPPKPSNLGDTSMFDRPPKTTGSTAGMVMFDSSSQKKVEENPFGDISITGFGPNAGSNNNNNNKDSKSASSLFNADDFYSALSNSFNSPQPAAQPQTAQPSKPQPKPVDDFSFGSPKPQNTNNSINPPPKTQNSFNTPSSTAPQQPKPIDDFGFGAPKPQNTNNSINPPPKTQNSFNSPSAASPQQPKPIDDFGFGAPKPQNTFNSTNPAPKPSNPFNDDLMFSSKPQNTFNAPQNTFSAPQNTIGQPPKPASSLNDGFTYSQAPSKSNFAGTFEFPSSSSGNFSGTFDFPSGSNAFNANQSFDFSNNQPQQNQKQQQNFFF